MSKLTLISPINARPTKRVSVSHLLCSETNQQSTEENVGPDASVVNRPTPLPLNDDTSAYGGNGVSVSESEVLAVSVVLGGVSDVARKEVVVCLQICRLNLSYFVHFVPGST